MFPEAYMRNRIREWSARDLALIGDLLTTRVYEDDFSLSSLSSEAYGLAAGLLVIHYEPRETIGELLALAGNAEAESLYLASAPARAKQFEVILPSMKDTVVRWSTGPTSFSHPDRWLRAFYLTLRWWETPVLDSLMRTRMDTLRASSTQAVEYRYLQVEAASALYLQAPDAQARILAAWRAVERELPDPEQQAFASLIALSETGLMMAIARQDQRMFDHEVEQALERHETYYASSEDLHNSYEAYFSLPVLGLCGLARHRGLELHAQSPYLPLDLLLH